MTPVSKKTSNKTQVRASYAYHNTIRYCKPSFLFTQVYGGDGLLLIEFSQDFFNGSPIAQLFYEKMLLSG